VLSYAGLAAEVARGEQLRALGVTPGNCVLLLMRDTPEFAAAWLGAVHAARSPSRSLPVLRAEYRHVRADSGARLAIIEDVFAWARPDLATEEAGEGSLVIAGASAGPALSWREALARAQPDAAPYAAQAEDPAFWLYSSGTTGKPKGIIHAHRSLLSAGQGQRDVVGLAAGERSSPPRSFSLPMRWNTVCSGRRHRRHRDPGPTGRMRKPHAGALVARTARRLSSACRLYRNLLSWAPRLRHFMPCGARRRRRAAAAQLIEQWRAATGGESCPSMECPRRSAPAW
jgi:acyl-CoA synthetase (AMP-forming)/AMP-acid ligase II